MKPYDSDPVSRAIYLAFGVVWAILVLILTVIFTDEIIRERAELRNCSCAGKADCYSAVMTANPERRSVAYCKFWRGDECCTIMVSR